MVSWVSSVRYCCPNCDVEYTSTVFIRSITQDEHGLGVVLAPVYVSHECQGWRNVTGV